MLGAYGINYYWLFAASNADLLFLGMIQRQTAVEHCFLRNDGLDAEFFCCAFKTARGVHKVP